MADEQRSQFNRGAFQEKYRSRGGKLVRLRTSTWDNFVGDIANYLARLQILSFAGGEVHSSSSGTALSVDGGGGGGAAAAWTFKLYNTTTGATGQIQVNGDDLLVAALNGIIALVNGNPSNVKIGSPLKYPQLSITSNGYVYAYVTLSTTMGVSTVTEVDIYLEGSAQSPLTDASTYAWILLGTIQDYTTDGSGNVSFTLANAQNTGFSQFRICNGSYDVW